MTDSEPSQELPRLPRHWIWICEDDRMQPQYRRWQALHQRSGVSTHFHSDPQYTARNVWNLYGGKEEAEAAQLDRRAMNALRTRTVQVRFSGTRWHAQAPCMGFVREGVNKDMVLAIIEALDKAAEEQP